MNHAKNCTSILIGRKASAEGSSIYCHMEDNGIDDSAHLIYFPRSKQSKKKIKFSQVKVPQVLETFAYWGIIAAPKTPMRKNSLFKYSWTLCGMNEYGVSIGSNGVISKEPISNESGLSDFEIHKLVLERTKNAREAVDLIGRMIDEYSQEGGGTNNKYCIGGSDGGWIVDASSKQWAALRCSDDDILISTNQYQINCDFDLASDELIDYAKLKGWYKNDSTKNFSFMECYGDKLNKPYNLLREKRIEQLLVDKIGQISIHDIMNITRDHFEGIEYSLYKTIDHGTSTEPYFYPPHKSPYRPICVPRTQASIICTSRINMPREMGNLMWLCFSSPCTSVYLPVYAGSSRVPEEYLVGEGKYDPASAWWAFDMLQRLVDDCHIDRKYVRNLWDSFEQREFEWQKEFDKEILQVYEQNYDLSKELLTDYTYQRLSHALDIAKILVSQQIHSTSICIDKLKPHD